MKTILICLVCVGITGCSAEIEGYMVDNAVKVCSDRGGIAYISGPTIKVTTVGCKDLTKHSLSFAPYAK